MTSEGAEVIVAGRSGPGSGARTVESACFASLAFPALATPSHAGQRGRFRRTARA